MIENILGCDFIFNREKVIGSGDFGTSVFEGHLNTDKNIVIAVKRIIDHGFVSIDKEIIRNLIAPPRPKHTNIVQYFSLKRDLDFWYKCVFYFAIKIIFVI